MKYPSNLKQLMILLVITFFLGAATVVVGAKIYTTQKKLIKKVFTKLEERRIARIPPKKEPQNISNFEKRKDLKLWKTTSSEISLSSHNAATGKYSAKVIFKPGEAASGIKIDSAFRKNKKLRNWEGHDSLSFQVFNPNKDMVRLFVKIKDTKGYNYSEKLHLAPKSMSEIHIGIPSLRTKINPAKIDSLNLFIWKPQSSSTLFIDDVKLTPGLSSQSEELVILQPQFIPTKDEVIFKREGVFDFSKKREKWLKDEVIEIPLSIKNPAYGTLADFPVAGGIPFPKGELDSSDPIKLLDHLGREIPALYSQMISLVLI